MGDKILIFLPTSIPFTNTLHKKTNKKKLDACFMIAAIQILKALGVYKLSVKC